MTLSLDIHAFERLSDKRKLTVLDSRVNKLEICELPKRMQEAETEISILRSQINDR